MRIYLYNDNGLYIGNREAREDPKEPGRYLIPRNSTTVVPSAAIQSKAKYGIWRDGSWHEAQYPPSKPEQDMTPAVRRQMIKDRIRRNTMTLGSRFSYGGNEYVLTDEIWQQLRDVKDLIDLSTGNPFPLEIAIGVDENGDDITEEFVNLGDFKQFSRAALRHLTNERETERTLIVGINALPSGEVPMPELWNDPRFEE